MERTRSNVARAILIAGVLILTVTLAGCDIIGGFLGNTGGGTTSYPQVTPRPITELVGAGRAIAYSGYRTENGPGSTDEDDEPNVDYPSPDQILDDLNLLVAEGFGLIRLYDSGTHAVDTLNVIDTNSLDLKVMLGAYFSGGEALYATTNQAEMDEAVRLANAYPDIVVAVSVGNETLVDWSIVPVPPEDLVEYVRYVRDRVSVPVTVNDNWEPFAMGAMDGGGTYDTLQVLRQIDFAAIHTYAYWDSGYDLWDWRQEDATDAERAAAMMDAATGWAQTNFTSVRTALDAAGVAIPIVIGETGWQSDPTASIGSAQFVGHPVNQAMYYDAMNEWTYGTGGSTPGDGFDRPASLFYFAAFDEPWKQADDNWGLWDVDRAEKYVLSRTGYTEADAVSYDPPEGPTEITEDTFVLFRDADVATGEDALTLTWNAWENGTTAGIDTGTSGAPEGGEYAIVTPTPLVWGWGMTLTAIDPIDLTAFETAGDLVFQVRTTYSGKIELGFFTGFTGDSAGVDVYLTVDPADNTYGYANDGAWHEVRIPISDITPNAAPAFGQSASATLNMQEVYAPFVIADRYAETGNTGGQTVAINLDNVRWEK